MFSCEIGIVYDVSVFIENILSITQCYLELQTIGEIIDKEYEFKLLCIKNSDIYVAI